MSLHHVGMMWCQTPALVWLCCAGGIEFTSYRSVLAIGAASAFIKSLVYTIPL